MGTVTKKDGAESSGMTAAVHRERGAGAWASARSDHSRATAHSALISDAERSRNASSVFMAHSLISGLALIVV